MATLFNSDNTLNEKMVNAIYSYNVKNNSIVGKYKNIAELEEQIKKGFDPLEFLSVEEIDGKIILSN